MDIEGSEWAILTDGRLSGLAADAIVLEWHRRDCPEAVPHAAVHRLLRRAGHAEIPRRRPGPLERRGLGVAAIAAAARLASCRAMQAERVRRLVKHAVNRSGNRYEDPICGRSFRSFIPGPRQRPHAYCPACRSAERHRVLFLFLRRRTDAFKRPQRVLHVAPELGIARRLRDVPGVTYVSTDLESSAAMVAADLTDLPFDDRSFDLALCSHVLEHIPDDVAAMRELRRVLAPDGMAVMQHPIDAGQPQTFEDWSITDPEERERVFFQRDHVRIYGRDFADRLARAGFGDVARTKYQEELSPAEVERYRLTQLPSSMPERDIEADVIYVAR
jgi:hypothetical protein